jgi:hypothetical protein
MDYYGIDAMNKTNNSEDPRETIKNRSSSMDLYSVSDSDSDSHRKFSSFNEFEQYVCNNSVIMIMDVFDVRVNYYSVDEHRQYDQQDYDYNHNLSRHFIAVYCEELSLIVYVLKGLIQSKANVSCIANAYRIYKKRNTQFDNEKSLSLDNCLVTDFYEIKDEEYGENIVLYPVKPNTVLFDKLTSFFVNGPIEVDNKSLAGDYMRIFRDIFVEM